MHGKGISKVSWLIKRNWNHFTLWYGFVQRSKALFNVSTGLLNWFSAVKAKTVAENKNRLYLSVYKKKLFTNLSANILRLVCISLLVFNSATQYKAPKLIPQSSCCTVRDDVYTRKERVGIAQWMAAGWMTGVRFQEGAGIVLSSVRSKPALGPIKASILCVSLCFNWAPPHEGVLGSGGIAPRILDLGTRWRWVVSFTPRPLYHQGKSRWYPLNKRLGGP
jgi:hypothetical protein